MKKNVLLLFLTTFLILSGSSDSSDSSDDSGDAPEEDTLVGTWVLTDLMIDSNVDDDDLDFGKQIIQFLQGINCDLVTFTFNENSTVMFDSKANFLSINAGVGGLDIPCPTESDIVSSLWVLDGNQLTISTEGEEDQVIVIQLEEDTLIIPGESIDDNNYAGADAVFTRQ